MNHQGSYIEVRNRKAEQFFFLHAVDFMAQTKDPDGTTVWLYADTEENRRIAEEFIHAQEVRQRQRNK